ncbi:SRPBCC family protein [Tenggerimyces flavus]|uniref:SRPBCC domain-containing protein n=1 Tax=Tenggerimyces flavus TaxID=1708749 RepID=A0ABV7YAX5_9ACTN|nr:SRPBCC domain-containing protein [Tenggerimyces flavus]MBM7783482.1 uncharacterized protein YndB with AHSA1/START domain [Tenggerimyces flavus]
MSTPPPERRVEKSIVLDATPEEVWDAVATGPGMSSWFVPHTYDDSGGGAEADFGGGQTAGGRVLDLEPGRRVVYGAPEGTPQDQAGLALEFLVEGRAQGSTVLRLVQSGFSAEDWEQQYEGMSRGWDQYLHNLVSYFAYFRGKPVTNVVGLTFTTADAVAVWAGFHAALGISPSVEVGDKVTLKPVGIPAIEGVVDVHDPGCLGVRSEVGLHRFGGFGGMATVAHYFYGVSLDATEATKNWQSWLTKLFPATPTPMA